MITAPPPPPPPPLALPSGNIHKPNNVKLLESINKGCGLRKVPECEKNDRSCLPEKPKSHSVPLLLPSNRTSQSGSLTKISDVLKTRQLVTNKGNSQLCFPQTSKKLESPQNENSVNNVPKAPLDYSKPLKMSSGQSSFLEPSQTMQSANIIKHIPPPVAPPSYPTTPRAPVDTAPGSVTKSYTSPSLLYNGQNLHKQHASQVGTVNRPPPPPLMKPKPLKKPCISNDVTDSPVCEPSTYCSMSIIPLSSEKKHPDPPPVLYSLKPRVDGVHHYSLMSSSRPEQIDEERFTHTNVYVPLMSCPPIFAPPPPPKDIAKPPPKVNNNKPKFQIPIEMDDEYQDCNGYGYLISSPPMNFDGRFTFPEETSFPIL